MDNVIDAYETLDALAEEYRLTHRGAPPLSLDNAWKLLMAAEILAGRLKDFIMEPGNGR